MSVEEAREEAKDLIEAAAVSYVSGSTAGEIRDHPLVDQALDGLILEAQAAMPCYEPSQPHGIVSDDGSMVYDIAIIDDCGECVTCTARAKLAETTVRIVDPATFTATIGPNGITSAEEWEPEEPHRG